MECHLRNRPLIGVTADADAERFKLRRTYCRLIEQAGGVPVILPCVIEVAEAYLARCDGVVLSGGDDPDMRDWGEPTHPKADVIDPDRQRFERRILELLDERPAMPTLGICLGMQLMGLHAGGRLDQHLPDHLPTAHQHWNRTEHAIEGDLGTGRVLSHHRQALTDAGRLRVVARAEDGVIEAVCDDDRPFYLGVQWHPERTEDPRFGRELFEALLEVAASRVAAP